MLVEKECYTQSVCTGTTNINVSPTYPTQFTQKDEKIENLLIKSRMLYVQV